MRFDIFTLFPEIFESPLRESILKRAIEAGRLEVALHNIRDWGVGKHHITDDYPYGGGGGMVMKPEPIFAAVESALGTEQNLEPETYHLKLTCPIILLSPQGRLFNQQLACQLAQHERIALICGRYEGVDERVRLHLVTDEISVGDFVLTGGELPALIVVDAVTRLLPGVLGDPDAAWDDSHAQGLLEYPHYTRPAEFRGHRVPDLLLSGHHGQLARWRREQSLRRTWQRRPDMLPSAPLSQADLDFLAGLEGKPNL
ncbi:MAG: tRNA (guanosine(37)-N1)-methyltransferase TrmD [Thermoflexales bacterium]|nr:tRNA (guanosine(37)-N1)-methyltransferase TrmD [Thermoflexales bacterium]